MGGLSPAEPHLRSIPEGPLWCQVHLGPSSTTSPGAGLVGPGELGGTPGGRQARAGLPPGTRGQQAEQRRWGMGAGGW